MAEDVTSLEIRVKSTDVDKADKSLKGLSKTSRESEKASASFGSSMKSALAPALGLAAGVVSVTGAIQGFRSMIQKTREFQVLRSALQSSTGSVENMEKAWGALMKFASDTPYSMEQAVTGFNKLVNLGLDPSQRALRSYGNTAAAMGKQLSDMIEAVADASTGEFERLKEFGIKANKEGDKITLRFRGVATEIKNDAAEIEKYLIELGENNFATNMSLRMETLDGKFSNLADAWDNFQYNLATSTGAAEAFGGMLEWVGEKVNDLNGYITSGQMVKEIEGWRIATEDFTSAWMGMLGQAEAGKKTAEETDAAWDDFILNLQGIPPLVVSVVQEIATDLWSLVATAKAVGNAMAANFKGAFTIIGESGEAYVEGLRQLSRGNVYEAVEGFKEDMAEVGADAANRQEEIDANFSGTINGINENAAARLEAINKKLEETVLRQQEARATADLLRLNSETEVPEVDLGQFRITGAVEGGGIDAGLFPPAGSIKALETEIKALNEELKLLPIGGDKFKDIASQIESAKAALDAAKGKTPKGAKSGSAGESISDLEEMLADEEASIEESYQRRLQIIQDNTTEGSLHQAELSLALLDQQEQERLKLEEQRMENAEKLGLSLDNENNVVRDSYEERKQIILAATQATEEEKARLMAEAHSAYIKAMHTQQQATVDKYLEGASGFFDDLSKMGSAFGKTGFKIAQGAAIAKATIDMYASAVAAYKTGAGISPVLGPVFAAAALAAGAAQIANIKSQTYQGEYAHGGMISAGKYGVVGEAGPELVKGPALITSGSTTADRHKESDSKTIEVKVFNYSGEKVETKTSETDQKRLIEFIVGRAREEVANDIHKGGTQIARAIEGTYGQSRGRRVG